MRCATPRALRPAARRTAARVPFKTRAMASPAVEIWVKGDPKTDTLLDCPFCHRVLLAAGEKAVPHTLGYIDFAAKPAWLLEVNPAGSVPVAKDLASGDWVVDSGVICDWLEDKWPTPALGKTADAPAAGSDVFPAFVAFLKADPGSPDEATKRDTLHTALRALDAHLASAGPWLGGATLGQADCALAPKLHHMAVALGAFKGWALPADAARVGAYLDAWRARPSWTAHEYSDEAVVAGWKKHMEKK